MNMKKAMKKWILPLLVMVLLLSAALKPALAYFTTYSWAKGGHTVHQESRTKIEEDFSKWTKNITVTNTEGEPVYVRARAFAGSAYALIYSGDGWSDGGDGWWYYDSPVAAGEKTASPLSVKIENIPKAEMDAGFNVAVVYESTRVQYSADGTPFYDFSQTLDRGGEQ